MTQPNSNKIQEILQEELKKDGDFLIQRELPACKGGDESKFPINRDRC
jgi:hypothetical protein